MVPFEILRKNDNAATIEKAEWDDTVNLDILKPASLENTEQKLKT